MNEDKERSRSQREKFEEAARQSGCDEDEQRWNERMRKLVRKPPPKKGSKGA